MLNILNNDLQKYAHQEDLKRIIKNSELTKGERKIRNNLCP